MCRQDKKKNSREKRVDTHLADPLPRSPARTPALMCPACRCICIHLQPSQPGHCFCRTGSGRRRSQTGTALWPGGGRPSSSLHTEPLSPARTAAAAERRRESEKDEFQQEQRWVLLQISNTTVKGFKRPNGSFTVFFITCGKDRMESAQFEYFSQLASGLSRSMTFSAAMCWVLPPNTSTRFTSLRLENPILKSVFRKDGS